MPVNGSTRSIPHTWTTRKGRRLSPRLLDSILTRIEAKPSDHLAHAIFKIAPLMKELSEKELCVSHIEINDPLRDLDFVAFDTETTGLSAAMERVVELSAVRFRFNGEELGTFDELIDPKRSIPEDAARIHGISDAMVKGKPLINEVLPRFLEFCEGAVLLAHNAEFDLGFLVHEASRSAITLPTPPVLDTVEISRRLRPDLPNHKLETIARALGCEPTTYHRALADAETLKSSFLKLLEEKHQQSKLGELLKDTGSALTYGWPDRTRAWLPPRLRAIDDAMIAGSKVTIVYQPEGQREEAREIVPRAYLRRPGVTLLLGRLDGGVERNYRLAWITRAHMAQATLF